jgi:hypothetical protein
MAIPTREDFGFTSQGPQCLDLEDAWDMIGGKTRAEFVRMLKSDSEIYRESLMFMGERAFAYYFEGVVEYVCSTDSTGDCNFINGIFLSLCERVKFDRLPEESLRSLEAFCKHVLAEYGRFELSSDTYGDIRPGLERLRRRVASR